MCACYRKVIAQYLARYCVIYARRFGDLGVKWEAERGGERKGDARRCACAYRGDSEFVRNVRTDG